MDSTNSKKLIRKKYLEIRAKEGRKNHKLIFSEVAKLISENFVKGYIGIYWPIKEEVDLRDIKNLIDAPLALPGCNSGRNLSYYHWSSNPLEKDHFGIYAPLQEKKLMPEEITMLFIPSLAIDLQGYRLGYGGGFYDRLRDNSSWRKIDTYAVLPNCCVCKKKLPHDSWDIPFKAWVTEKGKFSADF